MATKDIAEDETLFEIPRSRILTTTTSALPTEISSTLDDPWLSLILVMIFEAQHYESSDWSPYFDVMPAEFDTLMYWTSTELQALRGSAVVEKIGKEGADKIFSEKIVPIVNRHRDEFNAHALTDDDIVTLCHLFGSTIMAYAFDLEKPKDAADDDDEEEQEENANWEEDSVSGSGEVMPKGMIPLADMLNANADQNNAKLFHEDSAVVMKSIKPIKKGEQIYNDYGSLPRADVLRRYGYVTEEYAKYDVVEISTDLITDVAKALPALDDKTIKARLEYLDEQGVLDTAYDISRADSEDGPFPEELGVLLNALTTPKQDFEKMRKKEKLPKPEPTKESLELLFSVLLQRRAMYGLSSVAEDRTKLDSISHIDPKTKRLAMALQVIIGEKEVLQEAATKIEATLGSAGRGKKRKADTFEDEAREIAKKQKN